MRAHRVFGRWLGRLGLAAWVGGLATIGLIAPVVFEAFPGDRAQAGSLFAGILARFRWLELSSAAAVVIGAFCLLSRPVGRMDVLRIAVSLVMAGLLSANAFIIAPRLDELRPQIRTFDVPRATDRNQWRRHFDDMHDLYEKFGFLNLVLGVLLLSQWDKGPQEPEEEDDAEE